MKKESDPHTFSLDDLHLVIDILADTIKKKEFVVAGSQAILASIPKEIRDAAEDLCQSHDLDIFADPDFSEEERSLLEEKLGPHSEFSSENDWEIEPIGIWVMMTSLPDWIDRMIPVETPAGNKAFCISPLDIVFNKAEAGREKDVKYIHQIFQAKLLKPSDLLKAMEKYKDKLYPGQSEKVNETIQKAIQIGIRKSTKEAQAQPDPEIG